MTNLRPATPDDAPACAKIMQDWMDATAWLPDLHTLEQTVGFCRNVLISKYDTTVAGDPVNGFISIEPEHDVAAFYVAPTGQGTGAALLKHAQATHNKLDLWVFEANADAQRFYKRHGFNEAFRTDGSKNDEKLPDIRMEWHA